MGEGLGFDSGSIIGGTDVVQGVSEINMGLLIIGK